jgi:U3 small nucleolar RNA-associated protein 19
MPHLLEPRLLLDFLVDSYDTGGVVSLLALNGLFILMHHYHLDYPDFYSKLYGLLEPSVFHVKYMPRFFSLMDTYLSSTHLPLYMVAAFAKKVARLALSAPPQGNWSRDDHMTCCMWSHDRSNGGSGFCDKSAKETPKLQSFAPP